MRTVILNNLPNIKTNNTRLRTGFRKIHRPDGIWQYKIGSGEIVIFTPDNERILTNQSVVTGMSWYDLERGHWKKTFKGVTPEHITKFIEGVFELNQ